MGCRSIVGWIGLIVIIIFTFHLKEVSAQAYYFERFTVNEGLPSMIVWDIHQDEDGYIWVGTGGGGVSRFDGTTFNNYTMDDGLRDNFVHTIFTDNNKNLWVSSYYGGVAKFKEGEFVYQFTDTILDEDFIPTIRQAENGDVWLTTFENGVFIYDGENLTNITKEDGLPHDAVWDIFFRGDETWIATHDGLAVKKNGEISTFSTDDGLSGNKIFRIEQCADGSLWLATNKGVTRYRHNEFTQITELKGDDLGYIFDISVTSEKEVWIGTENAGIYVIEDYQAGKVKRFTNRSGLSSNYIYRLFEDRDQNMWVGSSEKGLNLFRGEQFRFLNNQTGLPSNEVLAMYQESEDKFWLGTGLGLVSYADSKFEMFEMPVDDPLDERVWDIARYSDEYLLLLLEDSSLWLFDGSDFINFSELHDFDEWFIHEFEYDKESEKLWLATDAGLIRFYEGRITQYDQDKGLASPFVYQIHRDIYTDDLWLSTPNGFSRFDGEQFENITYQDGLLHHEVNYITQDRYGDIWAGTPKGVTYYRPNEDGQPLVHFTEEDGMVVEETVSLWFDDNEQLWQATHAGIQRLDVAGYRETGEMDIIHHRLSRFGKGVEANFNAVMEDSRGRAWFGTMEGVIKLDPNDADPGSPPTPLVQIENVALNAQPIEWSDYTDELDYRYTTLTLPAVTFPHGNNSYTFSFGAIDFTNTDNLEFRYKLEGLEEDWRCAEGVRNATYTNLPAGNYEFRVQARNRRGEWSESAQYTFSIDVPFWYTYWFWGAILLTFGAAGYGLMHYRRYKYETQTLQRKVKEKTRDLTNALRDKDTLLKETHHRVKNNLAVIYSLLEMQKQHLDSPNAIQVINDSQLRINTISEVHENLYQQDRFSRICAEDYIKDLVRKISQSYDTGEKSISLKFDIDHLDLNMKYAIPCGLILNELITNAYKYAFEERDKGTISIRMKDKEDQIALSVADDGVGMPDEQEVSPNTLGMSIVKSLTRQLDGELDIKSDENGTRFEINIYKHTIIKEPE